MKVSKRVEKTRSYHYCSILSQQINTLMLNIHLYQWTDFRRKQNNPHKWTLISMFCWFDFFVYFSYLFFLIIFSCLFFHYFFFIDLVKVVCRLNFVWLFLMKVGPVCYYQASGLMTFVFSNMFMRVYFLTSLD